MAVEKFKVGYYYRFWPSTSEVPPTFVEEMEPMLDGKWRKCVKISSCNSSWSLFDGISANPGQADCLWGWRAVMHTMEECPIDPKKHLSNIIDEIHKE